MTFGNTGHLATVLGLGVDSALSDLTGQIVLRGYAVLPQGLTEDEFEWSVFLDGVRVAVVERGSLIFLDRPGSGDLFHARVDVLGVLRDGSTDALEDCTTFYCYPAGSRVLLEWTDQPEEADFDAYLIYYDQGLGGAVDTLLAEISELDTMRYVVEGLSSGVYVFKVLYRDTAGNIGNGALGDLGLTATGLVNPAPNAPTIDNVTVADRVIVAEFSAPADTTGIVGYYWALNQHPEHGELPYCETAPEWCIWVPVGGSTTLTFPAVAGHWQLGCYSVTSMGIASELATETFDLIEDGLGDLVLDDSTGKPALIVDLAAESGAAATVDLSCTATVNEDGRVEFWRATSQTGTFALVDSDAYDSSGAYALTDSGPLVDGTLYWYKARGVNVNAAGGEIAGDFSEPSQALADSTPPSGDQIITAMTMV